MRLKCLSSVCCPQDSQCLVFRRWQDGSTALHCAARDGDTELAMALIKIKADLSIPDQVFLSPLSLFAYSSRISAPHLQTPRCKYHWLPFCRSAAHSGKLCGFISPGVVFVPKSKKILFAFSGSDRMRDRGVCSCETSCSSSLERGG